MPEPRDVTPRFKEGSVARRKKRARERVAAGDVSFRAATPGTWREAVLFRDGRRCVACQWQGRLDHPGLAAHHLIFKSHCRKEYRLDIRNGVTLCTPFARSGYPGCHHRLHHGEMKIQQAWLRSEIIECLMEQGLYWDLGGYVHGTLSRYFADVPKMTEGL